MNGKVTSLQVYIRWLLTQYGILQKAAQQDAYRIINIETGTNPCLLTIQVVGKSTTFKCTPEEIAADDQMLECFSRKDVRTITYYACHEIKKPQHRIIIQKFCDKLGKMLFGIQKRDETTIFEKTAAQISLDKTLLNDMSQEDAHLVGYATATEQIVEEKEQMEKLSKV